MPELPEVETIRRQLAPHLMDRRIVEADSHSSGKFTPARDTTGATFTSVNRRGKYLIIGLDADRELIVHLGMTGAFAFRVGGEPSTHVRAWWELDDGRTLDYEDVRRFGRLRVVPVGDYSSAPTLHTQGPEPEDLVPLEFWQSLRSSKRRLKTQLLSQRPVAGVGNIYADEALWRAGIHPGVRSLSRARSDRLLAAVQDVIAQGIENGGTTLRDYRGVDGEEGSNQRSLDCYGRGGEPCHRCGQPLRSVIYDARTTTFCPRCQPR